MAPLASIKVDAVIMFKHTGRGLGGKDGSTAPTATSSEDLILQVLSLVCATISIMSGLVSFLWFLRMRTSFRHDLIMLLIQSDTFKAVWFMVFPITSFIHGPIPTKSKFCQSTGFLLATGIEAADVAILLIALHTALYVFGQQSNTLDRGLYPYRRYAYVAWLLFPLLAASLAFINTDGYISQSTFCYLPVRPFWYRLALSWIPRYTIFLVIIALFAAIHLYVHRRIRNFGRERAGNLQRQLISVNRLNESPQQQTPNLPMPVLNSHGLLPNSRPASLVGLEMKERISIATLSPTHWTFKTRRPKNDSTPALELPTSDTDSFAGPSPPEPMPKYVTKVQRSPCVESSTDSEVPSVSRLSFWRGNLVGHFSPNRTATGKSSNMDIFSILRKPPMSTTSSTPVHGIRLINTIGQDLQVVDLMKTQKRFQRQIRCIFVYPLLYMAIYTLPFCYHLLMYNERLATHPPFALRCMVIMLTCLQAAADSVVFALRETPWTHIPGHDGSFWGSLRFWTGWGEFRKRRKVSSSGPGKTREEMHREAMVAYRRRDEELAERRNTTIPSQVEESVGNRKRERSWWDLSGLDILMTEGSRSDSGQASEADRPSSSINSGAL